MAEHTPIPMQQKTAKAILALPVTLLTILVIYGRLSIVVPEKRAYLWEASFRESNLSRLRPILRTVPAHSHHNRGRH